MSSLQLQPTAFIFRYLYYWCKDQVKLSFLLRWQDQSEHAQSLPQTRFICGIQLQQFDSARLLEAELLISCPHPLNYYWSSDGGVKYENPSFPNKIKMIDRWNFENATHGEMIVLIILTRWLFQTEIVKLCPKTLTPAPTKSNTVKSVPRGLGLTLKS